MLFTSAAFFFAYLPVTLGGFFLLARFGPPRAAAWLFAASLFFYGYWMPQATWLLLASILLNYAAGTKIVSARGCGAQRRARAWAAAGIACDLTVLGYFKYFNFFADNLALLLGAHWQIGRVVLPIGISFFTFTQIAFLVDTLRGDVREYRFVNYGLFVSYFPHLVAGPVLHHAQMMPQFADRSIYRADIGRMAAGLAIFALGLGKKVVLADGIAPYADAVFSGADAGTMPGTHEAWLGAVAYTLQLYFDFSGYSDMAIGLSWMLNIRLPFNFDSPYRSTSIIEFWRRWHMTLSAFLRDYLYIALGGNRKGAIRRYLNLGLTMLLGGLWHGASWTFVFWGGLHGAYLMINHAFRAAWGTRRSAPGGRAAALGGWGLTMIAVVAGWVFFRAETFAGAVRVLQGMAGLAATEAMPPLLWNAGLPVGTGAVWCAVLGAFAVLPVNSNRIGLWLLERCRETAMACRIAGTALVAAALLVVLNASRESVSAFIYFNF